MSTFELNTSYKSHTLVAALIGIWLAVFLVLIAPFDAAELPIHIRIIILPFYGFISFIGYLILIPFQNWMYQRTNQWTLILESIIIFLFNMLLLVGSFIYYKSTIINGDYPFIKFTFEVYYPIFFIILPMLVFARWYINRKNAGSIIPQKIVSPEVQPLVLTGDNKLDILQLMQTDLISISSADNYVEINYLKEGVIEKKLLRSTLKRIHLEVPDLVKVHRSHLINPLHFKEWKNANTIILAQLEIPVSKNYKAAVLAIGNSSLKTNDSPQSP